MWTYCACSSSVCSHSNRADGGAVEGKPDAQEPEPWPSLPERQAAFNKTTSSIVWDFLNFTCCVLFMMFNLYIYFGFRPV